MESEFIYLKFEAIQADWLLGHQLEIQVQSLENSITTDLNSTLTLQKPSPQSHFSFQILANQTVLGFQQYSVQSLLDSPQTLKLTISPQTVQIITENQSQEQSLTVIITASQNQNFETPKSYEQKDTENPLSIVTNPDQITQPKSSCHYFNTIQSLEYYLNSSKNIIQSLKQTMGFTFQKLLAQASKPKAKTPTRPTLRSPVRRGAKRSPSKSPISTNVSRISKVQKELVVQIPSNQEALIESLGEHTMQTLALSVVGILLKHGLFEGQEQIGESGSSITEKISNDIPVILGALQHTEELFQKDFEHLQQLRKEIDDLQNTENELQNVEKLNKGLQQEKVKVQEEIKLIEEAIQSISDDQVQQSQELKLLQEQLEQTDNQSKELVEKFQQKINQFNVATRTSSREQLNLTDEKDTILKQLKQSQILIDTLSHENRELVNKIIKALAQNQVELDIQSSIKSAEQFSDFKKGLSQNLLSKSNQLKLSAEQTEPNTKKVIQTIQDDISKLISHDAKLSNIISEKQQELKQIPLIQNNQKIQELKQEVQTKIQLASSLKYQQKTPLNLKMLKDQTIQELNFVSDLMLRSGYSYQNVVRIDSTLRAITKQRNTQIETLSDILNQFKKTHPVHFINQKDFIDVALGNYLNARDHILELPFIRKDHGLYLYGTRKILIRLERNKLLVKVGGGFLNIEDFIEKYTDVELDKINNREYEASPKTKKFLSKWVQGLVYKNCTKENPDREALVRALEDKRYSPVIGVKSKTQSDYSVINS